MTTQAIAVIPTYHQQVALLAAELARSFRSGRFDLDQLHIELAQRCRTHPLLHDADRCEQVLASSAFADAALRMAHPPPDYSLSALATYALQADVALVLTQRLRIPLRPTSRC